MKIPTAQFPACARGPLFGLLLCMAPSVTNSQTIVIDTDLNDNPTLNAFGVAQVTDINAATTNPLGLPRLGGADEDTIPSDNYVEITSNLEGQRGTIIFDDPTGGLPIGGFTIRADLRVGGGSTNPADGFSFNLVRPTDPLIGTGEGYAASPTGELNLPEEGSTTGIAIGFDEWFSGGSDTVGMSIRLDNTILREIPLGTRNGALNDITSLQTGPLGPQGESDDTLLGWAPIEITLDAGILSISWKGNVVFSEFVNWTPSPGQIVLGGRTGGARAHHHMDNLYVEVTGANEAQVTGIRTGYDFLEIDVTDLATSVLDPATISLVIAGNDVSGGISVNKVGATTTIRHNQLPQFVFDTPIPFQLTAQDTFGQAIERDDSFAVAGPVVTPTFGLDFVEFEVPNLGTSILNPASVTLSINGTDVSAGLTITTEGGLNTILHNQDPLFVGGTNLNYVLSGLDNFGQNIDLTGTLLVVEPAFPFKEELAGADEASVDGNWGVRYIWNGLELATMTSALDLVKQAAADPVGFTGTFVDTSEPMMNHSAGSSGFVTPDLPYHPDALAAGLPADNYAMYGVACMIIEEAGTYTIGTHSDDGFAFRVHGWEFDEVFGNGQIDTFSRDTILHPAPTGDSNTRAVATLEAGIYRIEYMWWEFGGGDHGEIYIAKGRFPADSDSSDWLPIGITAPGGTFAVPGFDSSGVEASEYGPGLVEGTDFTMSLNPNGGDDLNLTNLAELQSVIDNVALTPVVTPNLAAINFNDPTSGGPGRIVGDVSFAIATAADDNDFVATYTGNLVIPSAGTYQIGFQGDDGGYLRIPGQTFTNLVENATGFSVIDEAGARIVADVPTGNSSTVGEITLAAGSYPIEAGFFERGGGAYFEVFGVEQGGSRQFLIEKDGARSVDLPPLGVAIVRKATEVSITDIVYNSDTDRFNLTWTSRPGKTYGLYWSLDLVDFSSDVDDSIPSGGELTSSGLFINPAIVGGVRPDRIFFRVIEN